MTHVLIIGGMAESLINFRGNLIKEFISKEMKVTVLSARCSLDVKGKVEALGVSHFFYSMSRTGMNPIKDIVTLVNLVYLFLKLKPDIVVSYTVKPVIYGLLAAWLAKVPAPIRIDYRFGLCLHRSGCWEEGDGYSSCETAVPVCLGKGG